MINITQTEDEIKIIIELSPGMKRKTDVVLLPYYIKFNCSPVFFERHLMHEVDEEASSCKLYKKEARIILIKRQKGIWPFLFQEIPKKQLIEKRQAITDEIIERSKDKDKKALETFEQKKREEINKEVLRETAMRQRFKQLQESACREVLSLDGDDKITPKSPETENEISIRKGTPVKRNVTEIPRDGVQMPAPHRAITSVRTVGKINVSFSNFSPTTPKRESQEGVQNQFLEQMNALKKDIQLQCGQINTLKE